MQNWKILTIALALTGLGVVGAGAAFAESTPPASSLNTTSSHTVLADDDWDDWYDDDHDDDWDDRWDD